MFPYYQQDYSSSRASNSAGWYGHANDASCPPYESQSTPYWREQHYTPNSYQQYHASHSYQAQYYDPIPPGYEHVQQYQHYIFEQQEPEPTNNDLVKLLQAVQQSNAQFQAQLEAQIQAMQQNNDQHFANLRKAITGSQDQCEHHYGSLSNEVHHVPATPLVHMFETQIPQQSLPLDSDENSNHLSHLPQPSEHALPKDFEMTEEDWESIYEEWVARGFASLSPDVDEDSRNLSQEQDSLPVIAELEEPQDELLKDKVCDQPQAHVHKDFVDVYLDTPKETPHAQHVEILKEVVKIDTPMDLHEDSKLDVSIKLMQHGTSTEDQHEDLKIGVPIRIDALYGDVFLPLPLKPPDNFWNYMLTDIWSVRSNVHYFHTFKGRHLHRWFHLKLQHHTIFGGRFFQWDFKVD